jgi:hypothetical protein
MKPTAILLGSLAMIFLRVGSCSACLCLPPSQAESFKAADSVFIGTVLGEKMVGASHLSAFQIEQPFKGNDAGVVVVESEGFDLDSPFAQGATYLVYAKRFGDHLIVGPCSRTIALEVGNCQQPVFESEPKQEATPNQSGDYWKILSFTGLTVFLSISIGLLSQRLWRLVWPQDAL